MMMSTRSGRLRQSIVETSPPRTRKGVSPVRSPARNRKSSPTVRSSRKSPSRKSPARKTTPKYPARKSPSRIIKQNKEEKETVVPKSPTKRPTIKKDVEIRLEKITSKFDIVHSTRSRGLEYSLADYSLDSPKLEPILINQDAGAGLETKSLDDMLHGSLRNRRNVEETGSNRSSRLKEIVDNVADIRRSFSKSVSKSVSKSLDAYSDEEDFAINLPKEKSKSLSVTRKLATPLPSTEKLSLRDRFEFGGTIGATALYILIPLTVFYILISCSKTCSYKSLKELSLYKTIALWFNLQAVILVMSNYLLQALLLSLPVFGTKEVEEHGRKYCFNALFSSFCTLSILFALDFNKIFRIDDLLTYYLQMATVSYLIAVILVLFIFLKSIEKNNLNPYSMPGYTLYNFFIGREIQVVLMNINIKLWLARVCNISTLIFSIVICKHGFYLQDNDVIFSLDELKTIFNKVHCKPTIIVYATMQIIYALYFIMRENKIVSTFYWHSEALGYLQIVSSALYPYYFTTISKNVAHTDQQLSTNALIAASMLFLLGFLIMLISNNIKHEFRKNPLQPSLLHLDSMPTFHGKKLLISNLWGILRHPNYAGDILIHTALALPGIFSWQMIASAPALLTIVMLLHRSWRDHNRCRRRYGAAWQRYCKRVPSVIIPKIL